MPQLVINVENESVVPSLKKAISMLRGVSKVTVCKSEAHLKTLRAIDQMEKGETIKCSSFEDYLKKVK